MYDRGMSVDDWFEDLVASLGGFYRTWFVHIGLETGLLRALDEAGDGGLTVEELAARTGTDPRVVGEWAWGAAAHELVELDGDRLRRIPELAPVLLDSDRPEYLGGQFALAAVASLDYAGLADFVRTGRPIGARPDRYRRAIERLTVQDVAVFFHEVLSALPQLVADLRPGSRILDVHCGGGRWLIAMARRFPGTQLTGVEFEADSVERARRNVAAADLADRITIEHREVTQIEPSGSVDLAYFQYALHQLPDAPAALRSAWGALRPGGRLIALDWYLPSDPEAFRSRHGELIAGVHLDELYGGMGLVTEDAAVAWFEAAGILDPTVIDLPSGATAIVAGRT